jgi:hypothetical protein
MDVKVKNIFVDRPSSDIDCELGSYDLPYEIWVSIDGKILKTNKRRLMCCYESNSLLSMADCFDYLSDDGKSEFTSRFLTTYLGPIAWKIKFGGKVSKKESEGFEFAMCKLKEISRDEYNTYLQYTQKKVDNGNNK